MMAVTSLRLSSSSSSSPCESTGCDTGAAWLYIASILNMAFENSRATSVRKRIDQTILNQAYEVMLCTPSPVSVKHLSNPDTKCIDPLLHHAPFAHLPVASLAGGVAHLPGSRFQVKHSRLRSSHEENTSTRNKLKQLHITTGKTADSLGTRPATSWQVLSDGYSGYSPAAMHLVPGGSKSSVRNKARCSQGALQLALNVSTRVQILQSLRS